MVTVNARKQRLDLSDVLRRIESAKGILSASRSRIAEVEWDEEMPDRSEVERLTIGPTGFLRAPALLVEDRLVVGFSEELYRRVLH